MLMTVRINGVEVQAAPETITKLIKQLASQADQRHNQEKEPEYVSDLPLLDSQRRFLYALYRESALPDDRGARMDWASRMLGRLVGSFNDLSIREASTLIDALKRRQTGYVSSDTLDKLHETFRKSLPNSSRAMRIAWASRTIKRAIQSFRDLTENEATRLMQSLV